MVVEESGVAGRSGSLGFAAVVGMLAGLSLTTRWGIVAMVVAAVLCGLGVAASEAVARSRQRPGQIPALWSRIVMSTVIAAPLAWALGAATGAGPIVVGVVVGGWPARWACGQLHGHPGAERAAWRRPGSVQPQQP